MTEILLTITQALQLVAIAPCIFVIAFLLCSAKSDGDNVVPIFYFLTLACTFIIPLLPIFGDIGESTQVKGLLLMGASMNVAASFLLVIQFLEGRIPAWPYWGILLLPLLGGGGFIYVTLFSTEVCLDKTCYPTESLRMLYNVFSASLIFLLLVLLFARSTARIAVDDVDRKHKYWLILSLVGLNVFVILIDLLSLAQKITPGNALLTLTGIRIAFIYLVLTSIFRVFYDIFDIELMAASSTNAAKALRNPEADKQMVERLKALLEQQQIYREMGLSREGLAKKLHMSEHQASRIINTYFHKNFNELINEYRIREAKARLTAEDVPVTTIAFEVGFNSIASFNRVFKEMAGSSPTEFRAAQKRT